MWNAIGSKAQKMAQGMSSAVSEIQADLAKELRRGGGSIDSEFDEAEVYKQMLVGFQMDQAKLGKETQAALREKEDEAGHWKKLYAEASGDGDGDGNGNGNGNGDGGGGKPPGSDGAAGALGVDDRIRLQTQVDVLTAVNQEWEEKLRVALQKSTEEISSRLKLEHEAGTLSMKVKELDKARAASEDLILALSAEKSRMLNSSGSADITIDSLVDEYSRLASEHTAQRQMDAQTIARLENVRDELVEKLKAHERNILQLLQKEEQGASVSQEISDRSVVEPSEKEPEASPGNATTTEEAQKMLQEQANELRAEKEGALAELSTFMSLEKGKAVKKEIASALFVAAEGHAAAMKRAKEAASEEKVLAVKKAIAKKDAEKDVLLSESAALTAKIGKTEKMLVEEEERAKSEVAIALKACEDAKGEMAMEAEKKLSEQRKILEENSLKLIEKATKEMEGEVGAAKAAREEANALYAKENRNRKAIHNKLMELQGNIRVFARVRPMVDVELKSGKAADVTSFPTDQDIVVKRPKEGKNSSGKDETRFEFDRVFKPDSTQESVFEAAVPLVTSVLDGYNVCIFAYGQTGSGKTFTMEGPDSSPGVNTRALTDMFKTADDKSADVKYTFHMSMMEVYNEAVYDILVTESKDSGKQPPAGSNGSTKTSLDIRQNAAGGTSVPGLTEVQVKAMPEVKAQLERGGKNRAVGAHDMNEHSSRSHMILNVRVEGTNVHTGTVVKSKLNLIDLAGSERISKTDATGSRLKEAQNINRSLSALGDVIAALATGKGHVPFRNSKLTYVLQDALNGNSKVMMFVNVSPASYNASETLSSLNFAARCRSIKLGAAAKNQEGPEIAKYRRASEALHAQLVSKGITPAVAIADLSSSSSNAGSSKNSPTGGLSGLSHRSASPPSGPSGSAGRRKSLGAFSITSSSGVGGIGGGVGGGVGGGSGGGDGASSTSSSRTSSPRSTGAKYSRR